MEIAKNNNNNCGKLLHFTTATIDVVNIELQLPSPLQNMQKALIIDIIGELKRKL